MDKAAQLKHILYCLDYFGKEQFNEMRMSECNYSFNKSKINMVVLHN